MGRISLKWKEGEESASHFVFVKVCLDRKGIFLLRIFVFAIEVSWAGQGVRTERQAESSEPASRAARKGCSNGSAKAPVFFTIATSSSSPCSGSYNISQKLFDFLFEDGIQLVTELLVNMKNKLMPFYDRMMLRKRYIIETINDMLKNTAQIVHSRHRSVSNFIMNLISALGAYCFFDNKPKALQEYCIEDTKQLSLF